MWPSEELGSPSLALDIEVSRSPSQLGNGTPLWDNMSLPSSPSLRARVPESTMNLNRYAKRGFSEDLALPPRQIEKPFRFLDLPAEIRNMIYELTFDRLSAMPCHCWDCFCCRGDFCTWDHTCEMSLHVTRRQFRLPPIAFVKKCIRKEVMSLYYATTDFFLHWDPSKVRCYIGHSLEGAIKLLTNVLDFAAVYELQIKSFTVLSPCCCHLPTQSLVEITAPVQSLVPLRRSLEQTGRVHPALREFKFADESSLARRIFDFAGNLDWLKHKSTYILASQVREFLRSDLEGLLVLHGIERKEWDDRQQANIRRKEAMRRQNLAKGLERWNGVLRSRVAKDQ
ncbi:hypothetical protein KCU98_g4313, partial [Aureobasidium melanogenum]